MNETPDAEAAVLGNRSPVVIDGVPCSGTSYRISRCGERAVRLGFRSQKINAILIREESDCLPAHNPQYHYNLQVSLYSTSLLYFRLWNGRIQNRRRCYRWQVASIHPIRSLYGTDFRPGRPVCCYNLLRNTQETCRNPNCSKKW